MGVGVEKAVFEHLAHVIVRHEVGQALAGIRIKAGNSIGVLHARPGRKILDQQPRTTQVHVAARAAHARTPGIVLAETLEVFGLDGEVQLVFGGAHQLVYQVFHRQARRAAGHLAVEVHEALHDGKVLRHLLDHARALHLHGHGLPAVCKHGAVHLRDGGRPQRRIVELGKGLLQRAPQLGGHLLARHFDRQRLALRAQSPEGLAVLDGQHVRVRRGNLPELHEGGAEVFEHGDGLLGRQTLVYLVLVQDFQYLAKTRRGVALVLGRGLLARAGQQVLKRRHGKHLRLCTRAACATHVLWL